MLRRAPRNAPWNDTVYLADAPTLAAAHNVWTLGTYAALGPLAAGQSYTNTQTVLLNPGARGTYIIVVTGLPSNTNKSDTTSAHVATNVTGSVPDLQITKVTLPDSINSGDPLTVSYTVTNNSATPIWSGTQFWTDDIYLSRDSTFIAGRATLLGAVQHANTGVAAHGSYTDSLTANVPEGIGGTFYVYVFINRDPHGNSIALPTSGDNGLALQAYSAEAYEDPQKDDAAGSLSIVYAEPELVVSDFSVPPSIAAGINTSVTFTVTNIGNRATRQSSWMDAVFLSSDASLDNGDYLLTLQQANGTLLNASSIHNGVLAAGASYTTTVTFTVPFEISGPFFLLAATDTGFGPSGFSASTISPRLLGIGGNATGSVPLYQGAGHNVTAQQVDVQPYSAPDLVVSSIDAPQAVTIGSNFSVSYTVTNKGGATQVTQANWNDLVYLSVEPYLDLTTARYIGSFQHTGGLAGGGSYSNTLSFQVPNNLPGKSYYVFVITDPALTNSTGQVFESNDANNSIHSPVPMVINTPPPTDLQVDSITVPTTAISGDPITVSWTVSDHSTVAASGSWTDAVYISTSATWDITAKLLGRATFSGSLDPDGSYTLSLTSTIPGLAPGNYHVIVRTNIFNSVYEGADAANNTTASAATIAVGVDVLTIGAPLNTTLLPGQERLYQVQVPEGQTLRVTLTADNAQSVNTLYIRYNAAPTTALYDATYSGALAASLTALVPSTRPGTYYVLVQGFSGPSTGANITLLAEQLPLVITNVDTAVGGAGAYVTTTITGAQFSASATVQLNRPGIAEFTPVSYQVIDSTKIIAVFDLTGAPLGSYDLIVTNPDGAQAITPYDFLVQQVVQPDVTIGIGGNRTILAGDAQDYSIQLDNLGNVDAPYTFFQVGVPQLGTNYIVYNLPYLTFSSNVSGQPSNLASSANANVPYSSIAGITDTNGQLITQGFLLNAAAGSSSGFTVNVQTYPGLEALNARAFAKFAAVADGFAPSLAPLLAKGAAGLADWWTAFKALVANGNPQLQGVLDQIDLVGEYNKNDAIPSDDVIPYIPFRFSIFAAATTMTRDEFITYMTNQALSLRDNIIKAEGTANAPPAALLALIADPTRFVNLEMAALESAGILQPENGIPPISTEEDIQSLMSVLASGILYGPAGSSIRSTGDLLTFFDNLLTLYGSDMTKTAQLAGSAVPGEGLFDVGTPIPALQQFSDYNLGLSSPTNFEAFNIYVPWVPFEDRGAGLPADYQINGPVPNAADPFATLNFASYFNNPGAVATSVSLTGPQTDQTNGFLPGNTALPYTINFQNSPGSGTYVNQITAVTQLDPSLDPTTFQLGSIKIGGITINIPPGKSSFTQDIDFTSTLGFVLRVSAGIDLSQSPAAVKWVLQAIDPLTGEPLTDPTRGLLAPNDAQGAGAGYVSWSAQLKPNIATGTQVSEKAEVLYDTMPPQTTETLTQAVDEIAPTTTLTATKIGASNSYTVNYSVADDTGGSGFHHVTLYVATDGGNYVIWQNHLTAAKGSLVFKGAAGHTYQFLGLATDNAGNQEKPQATTASVPSDGSSVSLGTTPTVTSTAPNFGQAPPPVDQPSTNALFTAAQQDVPSAAPSSRASAFTSILAPFVGEDFTNGIAQSEAGIGPQAIVELPDGTFLISGGANRGSLYHVGSDGQIGTTTPLITLNEPIVNMAFDKTGELWATTAGGPLLQLDPSTGQILGSYGIGITNAIAVDPTSGTIYVSTASGISTFDPVSHTFTQWSRDENLLVNSIAIDNEGNVWAVTLPDRATVVEFSDRQRAVTKLTFNSAIDSIAFGKTGSVLAGLLFVSHNSGPVDSTGAASALSELTMVDVATLQQVALATGGSRGGVLITTSDGRVLLSQTNEVDQISPAFAPSVVATNPPASAVVPLPLPFISVTFDQDMSVDGAQSGNVLNTANYKLVGAAQGTIAVQSVVYNAATRTVLLAFGPLLPDAYTLTVTGVVSSNNIALPHPYVTTFQGLGDLAAVVDIKIDDTRTDRTTGTISYDLTLTNISTSNLFLPAVLVLDPASGTTGLPQGTLGRTDDGRYLIDLSADLPENGILAPGASIVGTTVTINNSGNSQADFSIGVSGTTAPTFPPAFTSTPPTSTAVGATFHYTAVASDPHNDAILYRVLSGPAGLTIDAATGVVTWVVPSNAAAVTPVAIQAFNPQGAAAVQRFVLNVANGDQAPYFVSLPSEEDGREGTPIQFTVGVVEPSGAPVLVTANGLPPGSIFNPQTQLFSWTPAYGSAGTYPNVTFTVTDGNLSVSSVVVFKIAHVQQPVALNPIASQTISEGDKLVLLPKVTAQDGATLTFTADELPYGATLIQDSGLLTWQPGYTQAGTYNFNLTVTDGNTSATQPVTIKVNAASAAPQFVPQDGWQVYDNQLLQFQVNVLDPDNPNYVPPQRDANGNLVQLSDLPATVSVTPIGTLPPGATFDPDTLIFKWTPTFADIGTTSVSFLATDLNPAIGSGEFLTSTITIPLTVLPLLEPPVIAPVSDITVATGATKGLDVSATDPQGRKLTLSLVNDVQGYPLPSFITLTDNGDGTAHISINPLPGDRSNTTVDLIATSAADANGPAQSSFATFVIAITSANEPPTIAALGDVVSAIGADVLLPLMAGDAEQNPLTYSVSGYAGATIVPTSTYGRPTLAIASTAADVGDHEVTVTVTDDGNGGATAPLSASTTFLLRIRATNTAPVLSPVGDQTASEGTPFTLQLAATDAEGDGVSYTASGLPQGATLDVRSGLLTWTPAFGQAGAYPLTLSATDGELSTSETINLVVANVTRAPIFVPVLAQTAREGVELRLTIQAADLDNEPIALSAISLPDGATFDPSTGLFDWFPNYSQSGPFTVTIGAANPHNQTATESFTINVQNVDRPPVLNASDQNFIIGQSSSFTLGATTPEAGATLTYSAKNLPEGATLDVNTGVVTWNPGPGQAGSYEPTFFVTDGTLTTPDTIVMRAALTLPPPDVRIAVTPSFASVPGQAVIVQPVAAGEANIVSLKLYQDGVLVPLNEHGQATITPTHPGKIELLAIAVDADGATGQASFTLKTRDPNDTGAPVVSFAADTQGAFYPVTGSINGTVSDSNLDTWTLEIASGVGATVGTYATLASGTDSITGALAQLDPSSLRAGFYTLRLTAENISGQTSTILTAIEVDDVSRTGIYERQVTDITATLDGIPFSLTRLYESGSGNAGMFGPGWTWDPTDVNLQVNVPTTGLESAGVYAPFMDGTRLYLTRPDGVRTGFTFTPTTELLGTVALYHPAWTADDSTGGWTLAPFNSATLTKAGAQLLRQRHRRRVQPGECRRRFVRADRP